MIQKILDNSRYLGFKDGYIAVPFEAKFMVDDDTVVVKEARAILEETKQAVIRMHKYVIKMINKPAFTIRIK